LGRSLVVPVGHLALRGICVFLRCSRWDLPGGFAGGAFALGTGFEELLGTVIVDANWTIFLGTTLTSNNESVTGGTNDGVIFVNFANVDVEFVDGSGTEGNLSLFLHQPLVMGHFGQRLLPLPTREFYSLAELKIEDLHGGDRARIGQQHFLDDLLEEFQLCRRVKRRQLVKRMLRLIDQRIIIGPLHFANALLYLHIVRFQGIVDGRHHRCHVSSEIRLSPVTTHDVIDDILDLTRVHNAMGHDGLEELLVGHV